MGNLPLRHELKFFINEMQYFVLSGVLDQVLQRDPNGDEYNEYHIRSLYFDTVYNSALFDKMNGVQNRDKYRIRIYDGNASHITLEKKSKVRQMTLKQSCPIDEGLCRRLMEGRGIPVDVNMPPMLKKLLSEMQLRCMRPVVIVEYLRYPYVEKNGNVRVTFDENICSSNNISDFLEEKLTQVRGKEFF